SSTSSWHVTATNFCPRRRTVFAIACDPMRATVRSTTDVNSSTTAISSFGVSARTDRKSTRLNSSHVKISYAVFCLKKKKTMYAASAAARARGKRGMGKALGFAGLGMLAVGCYLGGHLAYAKGASGQRTAWQQESEV